jgi:type IV secretion system protein VirB2
MRRIDFMFVLAIAAIAVVISGDAAWATSSAQFQPLNNALTGVLTFMTGTFATTAATVAVAAVGYLAMTSRIPWPWCFSVVIGIALIFGAASIVTSLTSGLSGG